ncbi:golgi matrix protein [Coccidioides immitis RS]|uniref:Golgi matrix protein n=3 Tax=Coccidioides immitis TaxID=5501 RepID=J3K9U2_COCIM|nr:golgi matrix protein [Coccidioides immitis RS]EAS31719.3 golgi matrix protein [Coccidioides immitis RS]KMP04378.1 hypothetical protein CIRG_04069 [Coccidioides immitis RMSCC 2394]KMU73515.1 hypothetical protein CISG_03648 [Coccidioides immitis RMSCC 3703]TPX24463.1 hypothetical protein DIZ76_013810 [Coccidioides immitis]
MPTDTVSTPPQATGRSKKNKKKKGPGKSNVNGEDDRKFQVSHQSAAAKSDEAFESTTKTPAEDLANGSQREDTESQLEKTDDEEENQPTKEVLPPTRNDETCSENSFKQQMPSGIESDTRFEALVRDRDSLRAEVSEMRRTLEQIQSKHDQEMETLQNKLQATHNEKNNAETQFRNLLGKVNTIKSQLGERLKADAEELSQARSKIEELEGQNETLKSEVEAKSAQIESLEKEGEQRSKELSSLRNRTNLSQQNWLKEREELLEQESYLRAEFEEAKQAMHNWEILAMEERSVREGLGDKVVDLEEQLNALKIDYERVSKESRDQENTIEGLQKALQEIQRARKQELRELVESSDLQAEDLRKKVQTAEKSAAQATAELEKTKMELERALPFEKEVKEKNLLIGKLRHEAVTLNEHLTKALRFLKKGRPEDNVDRNLVTNHFLHFLALDRSDPKKFQVLQLIAALLGWTDEQREQAGLARPGSTASLSLRVPGASLVQRTPSSPALATDYFSESTPSRKESLAELWSSFLEQEAQTGKEQKDSKAEGE